MRIFISHSSQDRQQLATLVRDLLDLGHEVWYDLEAAATPDWWSEIVFQITQCDLFILALSPHSLMAAAVQTAFAYAHRLKKRILPVLIEQIEDTLRWPELASLPILDHRMDGRRALLGLLRELDNLPPPAPLPTPIPPPPALPLPTQETLNAVLHEPSLSADMQQIVLGQIGQLFHVAGMEDAALTALQQLHERDDTADAIKSSAHKMLRALGLPALQARPLARRHPGVLRIDTINGGRFMMAGMPFVGAYHVVYRHPMESPQITQGFWSRTDGQFGHFDAALVPMPRLDKEECGVHMVRLRLHGHSSADVSEASLLSIGEHEELQWQEFSAPVAEQALKRGTTGKLATRYLWARYYVTAAHYLTDTGYQLDTVLEHFAIEMHVWRKRQVNAS